MSKKLFFFGAIAFLCATLVLVGCPTDSDDDSGDGGNTEEIDDGDTGGGGGGDSGGGTVTPATPPTPSEVAKSWANNFSSKVKVTGATVELTEDVEIAAYISVPPGVTLKVPKNWKLTVNAGAMLESLENDGIVIEGDGLLVVEKDAKVMWGTRTLGQGTWTSPTKNIAQQMVKDLSEIGITNAALAEDGSVKVTGAITVTEDQAFNVPAGVKVSVGQITVEAGADFNVPDGASIEVGDKLDVKQGGELKVKKDGSLKVENNADLNLEGNLNVAEGATFEVSGTLTIGEKSAGLVSGTITIKDGGTVLTSDARQIFGGKGSTVVEYGGVAKQTFPIIGEQTLVGPSDSGAALELTDDNSKFEFSNTEFKLTGSAKLNGLDYDGIGGPLTPQYLIGQSQKMEVNGELTIADNVKFYVKGTKLTIGQGGNLVGAGTNATIIIMTEDGVNGEITGNGATNFYANGGNATTIPQAGETYTWVTDKWVCQ
jgi:hypothetical protein